jgi:hypothetical protein
MPLKSLFGILLYCMLSVVDVHGQWVQTDWPHAVTCFASRGGMLLAGSCCPPPACLIRSLDSGTTWVVVDTSLIPKDYSFGVQSIAVSGTSIVVGTGDAFPQESFQGIYRSSDVGRNWSHITAGVPQKPIASILYDGSMYFAATGSGILASSDDGLTWRKSGLDGIAVHGIISINSTIIAGTVDNGVYRSSDRGSTWSRVLDDTLGQSAGGRIWIVAGDGGLTVATPFGGLDDSLFFSTDAGYRWTSRPLFPPDGVSFGDADALSVYGGTVFVGWQDALGGVTMSRDTGTSWDEIGTMHRVNSLYVFGSHLFAGTNATGLYRASLTDLGVDGVSQSVERYSVSLSPNPATSELDLTLSSESTNESFDVFDDLGRRIEGGRIPTGTMSYRIDLRTYPTGVYSVRIGLKMLRFVKQ